MLLLHGGESHSEKQQSTSERRRMITAQSVAVVMSERNSIHPITSEKSHSLFMRHGILFGGKIKLNQSGT